MFSALQNYPNIEIAKELHQGFENGFSLNYHGSREFIKTKNMVSAVEKQAEVSEKLNKEIQMGRIMGPFDTPPISNLRTKKARRLAFNLQSFRPRGQKCE